MFVSVRRVQCRTRHLCIAFILDVCVCESCWVTNIFVQLARKLKLNTPSSQPDYFTIQKLYVEYDKYVKRECVFIVYTYHKPYYKFKLCNNAGCVCVCVPKLFIECVAVFAVYQCSPASTCLCVL